MGSIPPTRPLDPAADCPHCGDRHPQTYTHCPKTGRSLRSGNALVGRVIADRYKIVGLLGEGGMGAVYIAEHLMIGRKVALKRLHPELAADANAVQRFLREARAAAATGHEHIVEILDLGHAEDGAPFLVMEHLRGQNLAQLIREEQRIAPPRACRIVGQVLAALEAVHRLEIVHRDLKPDNVFLTRRGGAADYVKVLDFGISKMKQEEGGALDLTKTGVMMGTPFYMSPEQARGIRTIDPSIDLYAVGVILYECITGRLPFAGENYHALLQAILRTEPRPPSQLAPGLDPALEAVVLRSIAKTAGARFATARAMHEALVPFGAERPTDPEPVDTGDRSRRVDPRVAQARTEDLPTDGRTILSPPTGAPTDPPHRRRTGVPSAVPSGGVSSGVVPPSVSAPIPSSATPGLAAIPASAIPASAMPSSAGAVPASSAMPTSTGGVAAPRLAEAARERARVAERAPLPIPVAGGPRFFFAASEDWQGEAPRGGPTREPSSPELGVRDGARRPASLPPEPRSRPSAPLPVSTAPIQYSTATPAMRSAEPALKGAFFLAALEHIDERFGPGAADRALETVEPSLRERLDGVILPMAWLPIAVFEALLRATERTLGTGDGSTAAGIGRAIGEREAQTTHRLFMQTATPSLAVERLPHFFRIYHARGECRPQASGPTSVRLELDAGVPESALYASVVSAFFQRFLELAGAKDVKGNPVASRAQGDAQTVVALRWR